MSMFKTDADVDDLGLEISFCWPISTTNSERLTYSSTDGDRLLSTCDMGVLQLHGLDFKNNPSQVQTLLVKDQLHGSKVGWYFSKKNFLWHFYELWIPNEGIFLNWNLENGFDICWSPVPSILAHIWAFTRSPTLNSVWSTPLGIQRLKQSGQSCPWDFLCVFILHYPRISWRLLDVHVCFINSCGPLVL